MVIQSHTNKQTERLAGRQADRQTDRLTDWLTDRQTKKQEYIQTDRDIHKNIQTINIFIGLWIIHQEYYGLINIKQFLKFKLL